MGNLSGRETFDATIPIGASVSAAIPLGKYQPLGIVLPTGAGSFEANTDAIYFLVSLDGTTYNYLRDKDGTLVYVTVAAANTNGAVPLDAGDFAGWRFVKVEAWQAGVAVVAQATAARVITLGCGRVVED